MLYKHNSFREQGEMYVCGVLSPEQKEVLEQAKAKFSNQQTCHIPGICTKHVHGCMALKKLYSLVPICNQRMDGALSPLSTTCIDVLLVVYNHLLQNQPVIFNLRGQFATENGDRMMQYTQ